MRRATVLLVSATITMLLGCVEQTSVIGPRVDSPGSARLVSQASPGRLRWSDLTNDELWDVISTRSDSLVNIGLAYPGRPKGVAAGRILLGATEIAAANQLISSDAEIKVLRQLRRLPTLNAKLLTRSALDRLRASPFVQYVEPDRLIRFDGGPVEADIGCSQNTTDPGPFQYQQPFGDIVPWNYPLMRIPDAWARAQGFGVTIAFIDTGIDPGQAELNANFATGASASRAKWYTATDTSSRYGAGEPSWADDCGHGTRLSGVAAAPLNGSSIVGVAYRANLAVVRHHNDVYQGLFASKTVDAIDLAAGNYGTRVIGMAFAADPVYQPLEDMIKYWAVVYHSPKLFIGAAGTTLGGIAPLGAVHFPASMPEVMAVTAVVDSLGTLDARSHRGPEVELVAVAGQPTTGAPYRGDGSPGRTCCSSNAVAIIVGIAALAWEKYPDSSASAIRGILNRTGSHYPTVARCSDLPVGDECENTEIGNGLINALGAVGAFYRLEICCGRPDPLAPSGPADHVFSAQTSGGEGPWDYFWFVSGAQIVGGQHTADVMVRVNPVTQPSSITLTVIVTDQGDSGRWLRATRTVEVAPPCAPPTVCW